MSLVNTGSARSARSYEPLAEDPKTREHQIDERIADNVGDFLDNHVLQLRLSSPDGESRALDEEGKDLFRYVIHIRVASILQEKERAEQLFVHHSRAKNSTNTSCHRSPLI